LSQAYIGFHPFPRTARLAKVFLPERRAPLHWRVTARGESIVLIGFMGAGKSSIGRTLARRTGLPRFDTDELISTRFGLPVAEIFARFGEEKFRDAETEILKELPATQAAIIVTGGGIVLRRENVQMLQALGNVVSLEADDETLFHRISRKTTRPLLQTENPRATMLELLRTREPLYRAAADVCLDTSRLRHEEVADAILEKFGKL
jgi:shikimate kinase